MDWQVWLAYFAASWVIAISPGSGAVLSMAHGLAYGVKDTRFTVMGLQLGLTVILLIAGVGVGALLLASATAFLVVKVLGVAYLIWLGLKQWRTPIEGHTSPERAMPMRPSAAADRVVPTPRERMTTGFLTNVTNPKGIVFMVAVLPQFLDPNRSLGLQLLVLLLTTLFTDTIVMHGYAFLASRTQRWLATARARRAQNRVFGGVLVAMGTSLLLVKRAAG